MVSLVPLCVFAASYIFIYLLFKEDGKNADIQAERINSISKHKIDFDHNKELDSPFLKRLASPIINKFKLITNKLNISDRGDKQKNKALEAQLYSAGITISAQEFNLLKYMSLIAGFIISFIISYIFVREQTSKLLIMICGVLLPFTVFRYGLAIRITTRKKQIEKQLPDVIDLLGVAVEAGMGFDQALNYVTENMRGVLIAEFAVAVREMSLGKSRKQAFNALIERTQVDNLQAFTSAIIQSTEMGISMKTVLDSQSESLRVSRMNKIKEKAAKVSIKMLIPMVGLIFPVLFIILLGPAAMTAIQGGFL